MEDVAAPKAQKASLNKLYERFRSATTPTKEPSREPLADQSALTVIADIDPEKLDELRSLLLRIRSEDIEKNSVLPFKDLEEVHFCRFLILERSGSFPDQLVYASNFDHSIDQHIACIIKHETVLNGFDQLFQCCKNYDPKGSQQENVERFIKTNRQKVYCDHSFCTMVDDQQRKKSIVLQQL
jgi:hypothetical protein